MPETMTPEIITPEILGSARSTYTWAVRMVCEEKGIEYRLTETMLGAPELRTIHPQEGDKVGSRIVDRDVLRPAFLGRFRRRGLDQRLRPLGTDRRAVGIAERHLVGNGIEIGG